MTWGYVVVMGNWQVMASYVFFPFQMEYERQVASLKAANAAENDFSVSQAEVSSRQAMLENASDIKVGSQRTPANLLAQGSASYPFLWWPW